LDKYLISYEFLKFKFESGCLFYFPEKLTKHFEPSSALHTVTDVWASGHAGADWAGCGLCWPPRSLTGGAQLSAKGKKKGKGLRRAGFELVTSRA
jgi:hypothetical protein